MVTPAEEQQLSENRLCKILPVYNYIKSRCSELYQPDRQLSIDERMVESKARTHFRQYIRNKPTKWGFKFWVLADITGYTIDFDLYVGKSAQISAKGLSYDVVMQLLQPYLNQGYKLFCDNFYTSPTLLNDLTQYGVVATGTLNINRKEVPKEISTIRKYADGQPRGSGYYFRATGSQITYTVWRDTKTVVMASTAFPGHSESTVSRRVKDPVSGNSITTDVHCPLMLANYNKYMGGVDKSDQLISYHKISRRTVRYWKTLFYHFIDIMVVNSHIIFNYIALQNNKNPLSENQFRDKLILEIISSYGVTKRSSGGAAVSPVYATCNIHHGSKLYQASERARCVYCYLHNSRNFTQRKCPDCYLMPALCQTTERDCHTAWHSKTFGVIRQLWYEHESNRASNQVSTGASSSTQGTGASSRTRGRGRPKGSMNRSKRWGNYKSRNLSSSHI